MENRRKPITQESRDRKRAQLMKRRKKIMRIRIAAIAILIVGIVAGAVLYKKYSPSKEQANLKEYYGVSKEDELAVIIDNSIVGASGKLLDGKPYIEYSVVRDYLNKRFYVDKNENVLLYTLADGSIEAHVGSTDYTYQKETQSREYVILKMEGDVSYIALDFIKEYTDIEFQVYEEPARIMIQSDWDEKTVATVKKDAKVRLSDNIKSAFLTEADKKSQITVIDKGDKWTLVRTEDGFIGYIKSKALKNEEQVIVDRAFVKQEYPNISKKYTINMGWHVVTNKSANNNVLTTIASTKGLTTISPTWFTINDVSGDITSIASSDYVNYAHQTGIEVWVLVKDFDGNVDTAEEMLELLSHTSSRTNLINELIAEVLKHDIDGINVDFEKISEECAEHYLQFLRELSVKCRQNGIVLSVDNYVPAYHNSHYDLEEQAEIVDYVIIMGYDEYYEGSLMSGPVASINYVKNGIEAALESVPSEKLINAVPFYTRLWEETPKTEEELAAEAGTEAAEYATKVTSEVFRMKTIMNRVNESGAAIEIDPETNQNYAEWEEGGKIYRVWIEDETSLEMKLKLIKKYQLAGVSAWRLGWESDGIWDLILKYVN